MLWVLLAAIAVIIFIILSNRSSADPAGLRRSLRVIAAFLAGAMAIWFATKNLYPLTILLAVAAVALVVTSNASPPEIETSVSSSSDLPSSTERILLLLARLL